MYDLRRDYSDEIMWPHAVANSAEWLDKTEPEWYTKIDLSILDLNVGNLCVCGQVFGNHAQAKATCRSGYGYVLSLMLDDNIMTGFCSDINTHDLWVEAIKNRYESRLV